MEPERIPIEGSSLVAAGGYDVASRTIRVWFHDGKHKDFPDQDRVMFDAFMVARSKGRFLAVLATQAPPVAPPPPGPLDTYEEDECCARRLAAALRKGIAGAEWTCPKCEALWKAELVGAVRHWRPSTWCAVF